MLRLRHVGFSLVGPGQLQPRPTRSSRWVLPLSVLATFHLSTLVLNLLLRLEDGAALGDFRDQLASHRSGVGRAVFILTHPQQTYIILLSLPGGAVWITWGFDILAARLAFACLHSCTLNLKRGKRVDSALTILQRMLATLYLVSRPLESPSPSALWYLRLLAAWNLVSSVTFPAGLALEAVYAILSLPCLALLCIRYTRSELPEAKEMPGIILRDAAGIALNLFIEARRLRSRRILRAAAASAAAQPESLRYLDACKSTPVPSQQQQPQQQPDAGSQEGGTAGKSGDGASGGASGTTDGVVTTGVSGARETTGGAVLAQAIGPVTPPREQPGGSLCGAAVALAAATRRTRRTAAAASPSGDTAAAADAADAAISANAATALHLEAPEAPQSPPRAGVPLLLSAPRPLAIAAGSGAAAAAAAAAPPPFDALGMYGQFSSGWGEGCGSPVSLHKTDPEAPPRILHVRQLAASAAPEGPPAPRYVPRTRLTSTRIKIRGGGAQPEHISPGYERRIAAVLAAAGQQLEGVYVRRGCIELQVDFRILEQLAEENASPGGGGAAASGGSSRASGSVSSGSVSSGSVSSGSVDIGAIIRALQLPYEVPYGDEYDDGEVVAGGDDTQPRPRHGNDDDDDHDDENGTPEVFVFHHVHPGGFGGVASTLDPNPDPGAVGWAPPADGTPLPSWPYVVSVQSLMVLSPGETTRSVVAVGVGGREPPPDAAGGVSMRLTVLIWSPDHQPLELSVQSLGRYLPLSAPAVSWGPAGGGAAAAGFLATVAFGVFELPPAPAVLIVGARRQGAAQQGPASGAVPLLLLDDPGLAAELHRGLGSCFGLPPGTTGGGGAGAGAHTSAVAALRDLLADWGFFLHHATATTAAALGGCVDPSPAAPIIMVSELRVQLLALGRHLLQWFAASGGRAQWPLTMDRIRMELLALGADPLDVCDTASSTEAPSVEAPSAEAPSAEAPSTEAPSAEASSTEAPSTEAPSAEAPSAEASSTEAPSAEASSTEVPSAEAPSAEVEVEVAGEQEGTATEPAAWLMAAVSPPSSLQGTPTLTFAAAALRPGVQRLQSCPTQNLLHDVCGCLGEQHLSPLKPPHGREPPSSPPPLQQQQRPIAIASVPATPRQDGAAAVPHPGSFRLRADASSPSAASGESEGTARGEQHGVEQRTSSAGYSSADCSASTIASCGARSSGGGGSGGGGGGSGGGGSGGGGADAATASFGTWLMGPIRGARSFLTELDHPDYRIYLQEYTASQMRAADMLVFLSIGGIMLRTWIQEPQWRQRSRGDFLVHHAAIMLPLTANVVSSVGFLLLPRPIWAQLVQVLQAPRMAGYILANAVVGYCGFELAGGVRSYAMSSAVWAGDAIALGTSITIMPSTAIILAALRAPTHAAMWRAIGAPFSDCYLAWRAASLAAMTVLANLALHAVLLTSLHRKKRLLRFAAGRQGAEEEEARRPEGCGCGHKGCSSGGGGRCIKFWA